MAVRVKDICLKPHPAAGRCEFDRVAQQVDNDAGDVFGVHHDHAVLTSVDPGLQGQA